MPKFPKQYVIQQSDGLADGRMKTYHYLNLSVAHMDQMYMFSTHIPAGG